MDALIILSEILVKSRMTLLQLPDGHEDLETDISSGSENPFISYTNSRHVYLDWSSLAWFIVYEECQTFQNIEKGD